MFLDDFDNDNKVRVCLETNDDSSLLSHRKYLCCSIFRYLGLTRKKRKGVLWVYIVSGKEYRALERDLSIKQQKSVEWANRYVAKDNGVNTYNLNLNVLSHVYFISIKLREISDSVFYASSLAAAYQQSTFFDFTHLYLFSFIKSER